MMAFEDFLDHKCDLYHIVKTDESPGYSLKASPRFTYPEEPDEVDVPCHFTQGGAGGTVNTVTQKEPQHEYNDRIKVNFPLDADIRLNDKVVDRRNGTIFYAELPRTIRDHHKYVYVKREGIEAAL